MRKPVISSEINPKFDGVPTACILPVSQLYVKLRYIENIQVSEKVVISAKSDQNLAVSKPDISCQYLSFMSSYGT